MACTVMYSGLPAPIPMRNSFFIAVSVLAALRMLQKRTRRMCQKGHSGRRRCLLGAQELFHLRQTRWAKTVFENSDRGRPRQRQSIAFLHTPTCRHIAARTGEFGAAILACHSSWTRFHPGHRIDETKLARSKFAISVHGQGPPAVRRGRFDDRVVH